MCFVGCACEKTRSVFNSNKHVLCRSDIVISPETLATMNAVHSLVFVGAQGPLIQFANTRSTRITTEDGIATANSVSTTADPPMVTTGEYEPTDPLREAFVEMLFALAVAQIAINAAVGVAMSVDVSQKLPGFAHLLLALLLIACSWMGWRQSRSPGMKERITSVFGLTFLGLLLDVLLVVLYFIVVQAGEIKLGNAAPDPPSALPEAKGLLVVFGVYAAWDLIADVFSKDCIPKGSMCFRIGKGFRVAIVSTFASIICFGLILLVRLFAREATSVLEVIAFDIALGAIILLFRSAKVLENPLSRLLRVTDCPAFQKQRPVSRAERYGR
jgi:hypothetical protein